MKAVRILQIFVVIALVVYFVLLHAANPTLIDLPFFLALPPALVVAMALVVGWLLGWLPGRIAVWRRARELRRLRQRVAELEQHVPSYDKTPEENTPVIPDRIPVTEEPADERRSG